MDVIARRYEDGPLRLRWNTLAGWHIHGVSGLPLPPRYGEGPGTVEYVPASQLEGAVALLHRAVPYLEDLEKMLGVEGGPGLVARAIGAEFPRPSQRGQ